MFNLIFVQSVPHANKGLKYKDSNFDLLASPLRWKQCIRQPSIAMVLLANLTLRPRFLTDTFVNFPKSQVFGQAPLDITLPIMVDKSPSLKRGF